MKIFLPLLVAASLASAHAEVIPSRGKAPGLDLSRPLYVQHHAFFACQSLKLWNYGTGPGKNVQDIPGCLYLPPGTPAVSIGPPIPLAFHIPGLKQLPPDVTSMVIHIRVSLPGFKNMQLWSSAYGFANTRPGA